MSAKRRKRLRRRERAEIRRRVAACTERLMPKRRTFALDVAKVGSDRAVFTVSVKRPDGSWLQIGEATDVTMLEDCA